MPELSTIYDYMRANASLFGTRILEQFPALHQIRGSSFTPHRRVVAKAISRTSDRDHGTRQTLATGADWHGGRGVRYRQDADFAWCDPCP